MLLPNDYIYTLLGCNSLLPIENTKDSEKGLQAVVQTMSDSYTKRGVLTINLYNQGRGETRRKRKFKLEVRLSVCERCMGYTQSIRKKRKPKTFRRECLPKGIGFALGDGGSKRDRLRDNAVPIICINGDRGPVLGVGGKGDGEELSEEIH